MNRDLTRECTEEADSEPLKPIVVSVPFELISVDFMHLERSSGAGAVWPGWQSGDRHPGPQIFKVEKKLRALL